MDAENNKGKADASDLATNRAQCLKRRWGPWQGKSWQPDL